MKPISIGQRSKAITSLDVAEYAGVSQSTVSKALRNQAQVRKETRARVISAAKELGYVPNVYATSLRTLTSFAAVVVVTVSDLRKITTEEIEIFRNLHYIYDILKRCDLDCIVSVQDSSSFHGQFCAKGTARAIIVLGGRENCESWCAATLSQTKGALVISCEFEIIAHSRRLIEDRLSCLT